MRTNTAPDQVITHEVVQALLHALRPAGLDPADVLCQPGLGGRLVVLRRDARHGHALLGVLVRDATGTYLGCVDCRAQITASDDGMCPECRQDLAYWDQRDREASQAA